MGALKVTIQEVIAELNAAIKNGVSPGAVILWADTVEENDNYSKEAEAVPGSLLLGVSFFENGKEVLGTLHLQPSKMSKILS